MHSLMMALHFMTCMITICINTLSWGCSIGQVVRAQSSLGDWFMNYGHMDHHHECGGDAGRQARPGRGGVWMGGGGGERMQVERGG